MDASVLQRLRALPPLDAATARSQAHPCKVCGAAARPFDMVDLNKFCSEQDPYAFGLSGIAVAYFRCGRCGFLFTPFFDDWSGAEFAAFIYNADYVKVDGAYVEARPRELAALVARKAGGARHARILDFGSGSGVFARHLAGHGFNDVTNYDPFSTPIRPDGRFDVVTCFEVIEHTTAPGATLREVRDLLADGGCVLFTTGIQPADIEARRGSWWYVGPRNGHASIFTFEALAMLGARAGLTLYPASDLWAFADAQPSDATRAILGAGELPYVFAPVSAPSGEAAEGWHALEGDGSDTFRWTRTDTIAWPVPALARRGPCRIKVSVPFRMEIVPGFAAGARVFVDGERLAEVRVTRNVLVAEGIVAGPGPGVVTVRTPPPVRPADLGASGDRRPLGLAVPTATELCPVPAKSAEMRATASVAR